MPIDFSTALELWIAYKEHGVLPRAGGYLDQPRWWRSVIRLISARHAPIYDQHRREDSKDGDEQDAPKRKKRPADEDHWHEPGGLPVADGWDALNRGN